MTLYDDMIPVTPPITPEERAQDVLRGSMSLNEWRHYLRTGKRMPQPDPACRECRGTGTTTERTYRNPYPAIDVTGMCRCVIDATKGA